MEPLAILIEQLETMGRSAIAILPQLVIGLVILLASWGLARMARSLTERIIKKSSLRPSLQELIETVISITIWAIGIMVAATIILPGLTPSSIIAGLGIGTVAIGFAFQDIFENFLAGILIMIREKMRIGDVIECEGIIGKVEHISLRETHIRKLSNEVTIVPNSILFKNPMMILTDKGQRRHEVVAGVSYDTDLELAQSVIREAVESAQAVNTDKRIDVFAREFNASSVDFTVRWWSGSAPYDMHESRDQVIRAIKKALDKAEIEIPFPYVTHTFKEGLKLIGSNDGSDNSKGNLAA